MTTRQTAPFEARSLRRALGNFATGVTIVTARAPSGAVAGVTANSFNSVSLDPPLVLWSLDKRSSSREVFDAASHFAVNILAADQIELSNQFARPGVDKFAGVPHQTGAGDAPLLTNCAARFECEKWQQLDAGDHWVMIGRVVAFDDLGRSPLVYHQGAYSMVLPHARLQKNNEVTPPASRFQGRLSDNVYYLLTQAVRSYQANYQPRQLATGLRTSEARMLMVLESDADLDMPALLREVAMPAREIEQAEDILRGKGLVCLGEQGYRLTPAGVAEAETLWCIAADQQRKALEGVTTEELAACKKVLRHLIDLRLP
ncbi:p-hydroxyphenylacetate 3-hydroxylase reductase component [uncultured Aquitalea sp.]|uniref:p-hydroxyphenylacetate 3-hydroxylase reductase component n=1 Tax=uncultured Aquitalea sp. TaxID=540272 RepID=UPI0025F0B30F|nr:flavin reductase family protein [uncultured Aquitalea sp.]